MQRLRLGFFLVSLLLLLTACPQPPTGISAPTNVQSTASADGITVTWDAVEGADGYRVFRYEGDDEESVTNCNPTTSLSCNDTGVTPGKQYRHSVMAFKGSKESSKSSKTPLVTAPGDTTAPRVTLNASDTNLPVGGGTITLTANVTPGAASIVNVEFFQGATSLGTDTTSPYTLSDVSVPATSTFRAVVTDSAGKTGEDTAKVTVDTGSTSCKAEAKSFTGVVNTPIKGGTRSAGEIAVIVSPLLADNCTSTVTSVTGATNGTVEKVGDKGFKFTPNLKFVGNATFTYTVSDKSSATVTLTFEEVNSAVVGNQYVWYVDNTNPGGVGTATDPFVSYTQGSGGSFTMRSDFGVGDTIYIASSSTVYQGTISMKANQKIIGEGVDLVVNGLTLSKAGSNPRMTASTFGFELGAGGETTAYAQIGTLEIKGLTIQNITGGPTGDAPGSGIKSDNLQGTLLIENVTISGVTGHGMYIDHNRHDKPEKHEIIVRNVNITSPGQYGIWVDDPTNFLIENSQITGVKGGVTYGSNGIDVQDEFGNHGTDKPVVIRNVTISGNAGTAGIRFIKNNKCRKNVNDNEQNCTNVTKENSTMVVQNSTITTETGIIMQTQTGEEDKMENGFLSHFEYFGDQGDVLLKYSGSSISCVKSIFEFSNSSPAQVTEARNKISSTGITCN
jgi:hypothetical protein